MSGGIEVGGVAWAWAVIARYSDVRFWRSLSVEVIAFYGGALFWRSLSVEVIAFYGGALF